MAYLWIWIWTWILLKGITFIIYISSASVEVKRHDGQENKKENLMAKKFLFQRVNNSEVKPRPLDDDTKEFSPS